MKTFKMLSFDLIKEDGKQQLPLIDGIVINQENSRKSWILELFISKEHISTFQQLHTSGEVFDAHVVISFPDNEPAPFSLVVSEIREIQGHYSVLLKGTVKQLRKKYAEQLLKLLLEENLSKEELLARFEQGMKERPKLREI
ncbi:YwpF-like protein OS=Ureibacillus acetophenoni OX=614649 GN=SAMN05877842_10192 PE=4 SV=1 [Ureibacillus acetophenoni]